MSVSTPKNYIGNTDDERREMLHAIGVESLEELLSVVPKELRVSGLLELPEPVSEIEMRALAATLAKRNRSTADTISFLGGGAYDHYIPTIVDFLIFRSEFYTAYTPYQPEVSQGTLQAMYEYQSMICELTAMDVSNASLYDGASGMGEAALMAARVTGREVVLVSETVNPRYRQVIETYCYGQDIKVITVPRTPDGTTDLAFMAELLTKDVAGILLQYPNYFGVVEPLNEFQELRRNAAPDSLSIVSTNMISLGVMKPPAKFGADIVVAEGQGLGNHQSFGGPYLGVFALKEHLIRKMPGRLVGATIDQDKQRGFVLVLKTREQDIRRERATSNICTNQGLNALAATVYMSSLGKQGIVEVAELCTQKAHYLARQLEAIEDVSFPFQSPFFNEFVIKLPIPSRQLIDGMLDDDIFAGIDLGSKYDGLDHYLLIAVTERRSREELDGYIHSMRRVMRESLTDSTVTPG